MNEEIMCILKIDTCPSLSGRSTLTYNIGCDRSNDLYLRLCGNTGQGNFNKDWVPLSRLAQPVTAKDKPLSAGLMRKLFRGKSVNTASFILAVLKAEGLIEESEEDYGFRRIDPIEFKEGIQALMDSDCETPPFSDGKISKSEGDHHQEG